MLIPKEKIIEAKSRYAEQSILAIKEYLNIQNWSDKDAKGSCPWHLDKTPSFIWNAKNCSFHCFSCGRDYDILNLYMDKGMTYIQAIQKLFENTKIEHSFTEADMAKIAKPSYRYPKHEDHDRANVEEYLQKRCISVKTLDYADVQSDAHGNIAFHCYDSNDILKTVKYRLGRKVDPSKHENKCWHQKDADSSPVLFNMNRIDPTKPLVITEGEIDCLSVIEAGYTNVVSIIGGSQNMKWIEYNWEWLEQFPKIIIWFDSDGAGIKAREEAMHRLGLWRTYYIETTDISPKGAHLKDANLVLYFKGKERVLQYILEPLTTPVQGVTNLADATEFNIEEAEGLYTGIHALDKEIVKLVFGTVNIVTGKSGEGKSVFVNQVAICQALQQKYDVFVFSGELPTPLLKNWVETNMLGREHLTLKDNHVRVFEEQACKLMRNWYSGRILVYDDSFDTTATALLQKMEEMASKCGTKVFLIDNLMMVDLECSEEGRLQAEKEFVKNLVNFAKKYNVIVFLVAHPRKTGEIRVGKEDIAGSSSILNLAHMVFGVHRYTRKEKEGQRNGKGNFIPGCEPIMYDSVIDVLKNRITGSMPEVNLYYDVASCRFYQTPAELFFRYDWDYLNPNPTPTEDPNRHGLNFYEDSSPL